MSSGSCRLIRVRFSRPSRRRSRSVACGVALLSVCAAIVLVHAAGGLTAMLMQRGLPADDRVQAALGGAWFVVASLLTTACILWLALRPNDWRCPTFLLLAALALAIVFLATGSRTRVILPVIIMVSIGFVSRKRFAYVKVLTLAVLAIAIVGAVAQFREASVSANTLQGVDVDTNVINSWESGLDTIARNGGALYGPFGIVAKVPGTVGFLYGRSYLSVVAAPVPGALWEAKPPAAGRLTARYIFGLQGTAIPAHSVGEAYWNFGVPGIVVIMGLFGVMLRWIGNVYQRSSDCGWAVGLYIITIFYLRPGSDAAYHWLQVIIPACVILVLMCGFPAVVRRSRAASVRPGWLVKR